MVRLKLMPPLTRIVGEKEVAVDVGRASLKAVIERAAAGNEKFRRAMLDAEGSLSAEYSCLVNGRRYNVADLEGVEVGEADEIVLLMPIAGGAFLVGSSGCGAGIGSGHQGRGREGRTFSPDNSRMTP